MGEIEEECVYIPEGYKFSKLLGKGAYGCVFCCSSDTQLPELVAVKQLPNYDSTVQDAKLSLRELNILKYLSNFNHPNIITLLNVELHQTLCFVLEYMETDLHKIIQSKQKLSANHIRHFMYQLITGANFLHHHNICHRDIKPANLLLNSNCTLKLADFGLARIFPKSSDQNQKARNSFRPSISQNRSSLAQNIARKSKTFLGTDQRKSLTAHVVTRWYRSPELMLQGDGMYDGRKVDIWSIGCVFGELLTRKPLFPGNDFKHQLELIFGLIGVPRVESGEVSFITNRKAKQFLKDIQFLESWDGNFKGWLDQAKSSRSFLHDEEYNRGAKEAQFLRRFLQLDPSKRISLDSCFSKLDYFKSTAYQNIVAKQVKEYDITPLDRMEKLLDFGNMHSTALEKKFESLKSELVNCVGRSSVKSMKKEERRDTEDSESICSEEVDKVCYVRQGMKQNGMKSSRWPHFGLIKS